MGKPGRKPTNNGIRKSWKRVNRRLAPVALEIFTEFVDERAGDLESWTSGAMIVWTVLPPQVREKAVKDAISGVTRPEYWEMLAAVFDAAYASIPAVTLENMDDLHAQVGEVVKRAVAAVAASEHE